MKKSIFIIILLLAAFGVNAQVDTTNKDDGVIELITVVESMPCFAGGDEARLKYISTHSVYTERARKDSVSGTIYVTFIVDVDGSIVEPQILRGLHPDLDSITICLIKKMPHWIPAKQRGKPVKCQFNMPIEFNLKGKNGKYLPTPSKYWSKKGKKQFMQKCLQEFGKTEGDCDCWYNFIIWNYNNRKLKELDLKSMFTNQKCK